MLLLNLLSGCQWMVPSPPVAVTPPPTPAVIPTDAPPSRYIEEDWFGQAACGRTRVLATTDRQEWWLAARLPLTLTGLASGPVNAQAQLEITSEVPFRLIETDWVDSGSFCWREEPFPPRNGGYFEGVSGTVTYELRVDDSPYRDSWWWDSGRADWNPDWATGVLTVRTVGDVRLRHTRTGENIVLRNVSVDVPWSNPNLY